MTIIELAIQYGSTTNDYGRPNCLELSIDQLKVFATVIAKQAVDEFKAGLVPEVYIDEHGNTELNLETWMADEPWSNWHPLYALPLGETK